MTTASEAIRLEIVIGTTIARLVVIILTHFNSHHTFIDNNASKEETKK